ncbi:MAG: UbiA prenyltransferase family protein [Planctomycetes bacterium]|nr:UbiA prenyltransferase family protein [Planctomycetota bacterium]
MIALRPTGRARFTPLSWRPVDQTLAGDSRSRNVAKTVAAARAAGAEIRRLLRFREWAPMLGLPLFGWICARGGWDLASLARLMVAGACCVAYFAGGYALNECADRARRPGGAPAGVARYGMGFALAAGAVALGFLSSVAAGWLALLGMVAGGIYSLPPVRAKGIPVAGAVLNAAGFTLTFLIGAEAAGGVAPSAVAAGAALLLLLFLPAQLVHEWDHREEDRAAGDRTTAQALGARGTGAAIAGGFLASVLWTCAAARAGMAPWWWPVATLAVGLGVMALVVRALRVEAGGTTAAGIKAAARSWLLGYGAALAVGTLLIDH